MIKKFQIRHFKYRFYYLKHYYRFLFVHKPLCEKFNKDTLLLFNKIYFCRSCFFLYIGFLFSLIFNFIFLTKENLRENALLLLVFGLCTIIASMPVFYKNYSRIKRDILRFSTGVLAGLAIVVTVKISLLTGAFALIALLFVKKIYNKIRKNVDICTNCPELALQKTCSGYKMQKEALNRLEEDYSKTLFVRKDLLF